MICLLVANYNNGRYLNQFFDSILNSFTPVEKIIFVDDASTDDSLLFVSKYSTLLPICLISLDSNVGFANALNIGLKHCDSEFVARIDPDDVLDPRRLGEQLEYFWNNPSVDILGSQAEYFDDLSGSFINTTNKPLTHDHIYSAYLSADNGVIHGTVMCRSSALENMQYFQSEVPSEDYGFFSRLILNGYIFSNLSMPLTKVRIHASSVSNNIKFSTINKVYLMRKNIFNINFTRFSVVVEFIVLYFYRRAMFECRPYLKFIYYSIAAIFSPSRLYRRLKMWLYLS